jgi:Mg-chelatase subunit ChlD
VNPAFICPLTGDIFVDPVIDGEGNSYERAAIMQWLSAGNNSSPITRNPLSMEHLVPNRSLLDSIIASRNPPTPPPAAATPLSPSSLRPLQPAAAKATAKLKTTFLSNSDILPAASNLLKVAVSTPDGSARNPAHVVLVIDVSGSMNSEASVQASGGASKETSNLSVLDITKHAAKTVIKLLRPTDAISVVSFTDSATVHVDAQFCSEENKFAAIETIDKLTPLYSTNLWDGLDKGMNLIKKATNSKKCMNMSNSVFLLTDGVPNCEPPRGHIPMLRKFLDSNPDLTMSVHTFGFGYSLDSKLLLQIANEGGGNYNYIPDAGFVGTVFVHAVTNVLCTFTQDAILSVELPSGVSGRLLGMSDENSDFRQLKCEKASWGIQIEVNSLQLDQERSFVIVTDEPLTERPLTKLVYTDFTAIRAEDRNVTLSVDETSPGLFVEGSPDAGTILDVLRLYAIEQITKALDVDDSSCRDNFCIEGRRKEIADLNRVLKAKCPPCSKSLYTDMSGQVAEAVSKAEWFIKWGRHYLPAIARAHLLQQCTNFKDPGMQNYGGDLFEKIRDEADTIFTSMPPPKASRCRGEGCRSAAAISTASFSRAYYNASNGCFHGDCMVTMGDGSLKKVSDIRKGDVVATDIAAAQGKQSAKVVCVVKTLTQNGKCDLVTLPSGLRSTEYHPVFIGNKWAFPCQIRGADKDVVCPAVYTFVLDKEHTMCINNVKVICLGHGILNDDVASHPYLGTQKIIADLKSCTGFDKGILTFNYGFLKRGVDIVKTGAQNGKDTMVNGIYKERLVTGG